jgi:hypothetical protein
MQANLLRLSLAVREESAGTTASGDQSLVYFLNRNRNRHAKHPGRRIYGFPYHGWSNLLALPRATEDPRMARIGRALKRRHLSSEFLASGRVALTQTQRSPTISNRTQLGNSELQV